jgi:acyl dehydratase
MATTVKDIHELKSRAGEHLGYSSWHEITQERIDKFAEATGDFQWIHVDPERARNGPFGGTIAHGYLTLSLAPALLQEIFSLEQMSMGLNYGCNRVRFPAPVPVGSRVRMGAALESVEDVGGGGVQATLDFTFELDGSDKPCCVAQAVYRYYG